MAMTNKEYLEHDARKCPFCGSDDIVHEMINGEDTVAWSGRSCNNCDSTWEDLYRMHGYYALNDTTFNKETHEKLLSEVVDNAVFLSEVDIPFLRKLLTDYFGKMTHYEIKKLHEDAFVYAMEDEK